MINKDIEQYIERHTSAEDQVLFQLNRETHIKAVNPRMLSGHTQGKFLELISKMLRPKTILEIGTYTGYSAICLAKGLQAGGVLHTIEKNDELATIQGKYFKKAGFNDAIKRYVGNAVEIIPAIEQKFDLVFIDADKKNYANYFNLIIDKVNPGGVILGDNVLWDGKVVKESEQNDPDTIAINEYNRLVLEHPQTETIILPIRDGISIVRKL